MLLNDTEIIELFWERSEQAIKALADKYDRLARSVAMNILRDRLDTEECVNDSYLGMWNSLPPKRPQVLPAFFATITRNLALNRPRPIRLTFPIFLTYLLFRAIILCNKTRNGAI